MCRSEILTHTGPVSRLVITESLVVSGGEDCSLTVIRLLADGSILVSHLLQGHVSRVRCVSLDGGLLLSGSDDRSAKVWSLCESWGAVTTLSGHAWPVSGVWLGGGLAVTADTSTVRLWSAPAGQLLRTISGLANTGDLRLDLAGGSLLVTSHQSHLLSFSLSNTEDCQEASWQYKPLPLAASGGSQTRLSAGHSTLVLLSFGTNSHNLTVIDFLSSTTISGGRLSSSHCST